MKNNQWDDLELFTHANTRSFNSADISIHKSGSIILLSGFVRAAQKELADNLYIELSYSKRHETIVLNFTNNFIARQTLKITTNIDNGIKNFAARSFLQTYNITQCGKFTAKLINIPAMGDRWTINLCNRILR